MDEKSRPGALVSDLQKSCRETCSYEAPDGGFGWAVLMGALGISILAPPVIGSFGILLYDIRHQMGVSVASTAWISSLAQAMSFGATPFVIILASRFSFRKVAFFGGISISLGMFLTHFAKRLEVLYVTIGFLGGLGMGFSTKASLFIVNQYFNKRRGFATGCYYTGAALSRLIFPMVIQLLLLQYGYRGTTLFWSGIMANICVSASLFQPVKWHLVHVPGKQCRMHDPPCTITFNSEKTDAKVLDCSQDDDVNEAAAMEEMVPMIDNKYSLNDGQANNVWIKNNAENDNLYKEANVDDDGKSNKTKVGKNANDNERKTGNFGSSTKLKLDFTLFKEPRFYVICCTGIFSAVANGNMYVFIPSMGRSKGLSAVNAAWLLSSVGIGEVIGRLVVPWIQDMRLVHPKYFFMAGALVSSFIAAILTMPESYSTMVLLCIILGVSAGSMTGLGSILNVETIGLEKLHSSLSFTQFMQGVFALPAGPILGAIRDATGDYVKCFYLLSAIYSCAFFVWLIETIVTAYTDRKQKSKSNDC